MQKCCYEFIALFFNLFFPFDITTLCQSLCTNRDNSLQDLYKMAFVSSLLYELGNRKSSSTISAESKIAG